MSEEYTEIASATDAAHKIVADATKAASDVVTKAAETAAHLNQQTNPTNRELAGMIQEVQRAANNEPTNGELALMISEVKTIALDGRNEARKTNGRVNIIEAWKEQNAEFINNLKAERQQMIMKGIDLLVKIVIGAILVKIGWANLIK